MLRILVLLPVFTLFASRALCGSEPVAKWRFDSEQSSSLELHGDVVRDQAGPRPPEFPGFDQFNTSLRFGGKGYVRIVDDFDDNRFDFRNGDEITIEAWVNVDKVRNGQQAYVIGKGRTGTPKFARNNQNWALRIVGRNGMVQTSFLFATIPSSGASPWHRWTSVLGFQQNSGWHHLAVAYRFGDPTSIRGWIDGEPTKGQWDLGGATDHPPVVDDDDVWIGSSQGGRPDNSFTGRIDEVAVHRKILSDETVASRFNRVGGPKLILPLAERMPEFDSIPQGRVLFTLGEGLPSHIRWLNTGESWPAERERWTATEFLLPRLPVRYDSWGIRDSRKPPVLLRMAADLKLPAGRHRVLLRARSLGRLWIDGKVVVRTRSNSHGGGNLQPIVPIAAPPAPGHRFVRFPQQEVFGEVEIPSSDDPSAMSRVVLELVIGSPKHRVETGEVCVAISTKESSSFVVLSTADELPLTDAAVTLRLDQIEKELIAYEDHSRRAKAASQDEFWLRRHEMARVWKKENSPSPNGDLPDRAATGNQVDQWIAKKIQDSRERSGQFDEQTTTKFHQEVLPILREHCYRCHSEKAQGGLRLDSRAEAVMAGDSERAAVVPGSPDESELMTRVREHDMPPTDEGLADPEIETLEEWISEGAPWPAPPIDPEAIKIPSIVGDEAFLRRAYLDIVGVPPSSKQVREFLANRNPRKRADTIDRLLADPRYADHWVSFWLDLLAENPTLLNVSMGSTGPFRWFLHESLKDNKPLDRMVTELILMRGDAHEGGSAGFGLAGENDSPMAAKAHILASALLGIELQCARCHDSPFHSTTQEELFSLAAMLDRKSITPPKTSRVPDAFFEDQTRQSLIRVTLPLGKKVPPQWPFARFTGAVDSPELDGWIQNPDDPREKVAALFTSPINTRFPRVLVNHFWRRLMGAGIVEPVNDWEAESPSDPEMLEYLATELVTNRYNAKHVLKLIMNSAAYQREALGANSLATAEQRFFAAPDRRRLTAEQIVDSLFVASGRKMDVEELTFVHDGTLPTKQRLTLGKPKRAWMFAGLNNERDRPSLSLPRAQEIVDVLEAFGWTGTRQKSIPQRESDPNVLQPGILANGTLTTSLSRAAINSFLAQLAIDAKSPEVLVDELFLRFLSRFPSPQERQTFSAALSRDFVSRKVPEEQIVLPMPDSPLPQSTWTNHLRPEANQIQQEWLARVRRGPPVDPRLQPQWREVYEDVIWSLINHREFVWIP